MRAGVIPAGGGLSHGRPGQVGLLWGRAGGGTGLGNGPVYKEKVNGWGGKGHTRENDWGLLQNMACGGRRDTDTRTIDKRRRPGPNGSAVKGGRGDRGTRGRTIGRERNKQRRRTGQSTDPSLPPQTQTQINPPPRPQRHYMTALNTCNHDPLLPPKGKEMRKYLVVDLVVALGTRSGLTGMVENAGAGVI